MLERNQKCIINTDLDGIFSGLLLHNVLGWEIVGFCDSRKTLWVDKTKCSSLEDCTFIDIFMYPSNLKCIDQHIIAATGSHLKLLQQNPNKRNPNLERPRTLLPTDSYARKYPFGTFHYLVALLEQQGEEVPFQTENVWKDDITVMDLLLRIDDALVSSLDKYQQNASEWWTWLFHLSGHEKFILKMIESVQQSAQSMDKDARLLQKRKIAKALQGHPYLCTSGEGGYKTTKEVGKNQLHSNVSLYIKDLAKAAGVKCFPLDLDLSVLEGKAYRYDIRQNQIEHLERLKYSAFFSYAFVRSKRYPENFSFTVFPLESVQSFL